MDTERRAIGPIGHVKRLSNEAHIIVSYPSASPLYRHEVTSPSHTCTIVIFVSKMFMTIRKYLSYVWAGGLE